MSVVFKHAALDNTMSTLLVHPSFGVKRNKPSNARKSNVSVNNPTFKKPLESEWYANAKSQAKNRGGDAMVGHEIHKMYWIGGEPKWFVGFVDRKERTRNTYSVVFDDGDRRSLTGEEVEEGQACLEAHNLEEIKALQAMRDSHPRKQCCPVKSDPQGHTI